MMQAAQGQIDNQSVNGTFLFNEGEKELTLKFAGLSLKQIAAESIIVKFMKSEGQTLKLTVTDESGAKYNCTIKSEPNSSDGRKQNAIRLREQLYEDFAHFSDWKDVRIYLLDDVSGYQSDVIERDYHYIKGKRAMIDSFLENMVNAGITDEKAIYTRVFSALKRAKYENFADVLKAKRGF